MLDPVPSEKEPVKHYVKPLEKPFTVWRKHPPGKEKRIMKMVVNKALIISSKRCRPEAKPSAARLVWTEREEKEGKGRGIGEREGRRALGERRPTERIDDPNRRGAGPMAGLDAVRVLATPDSRVDAETRTRCR